MSQDTLSTDLPSKSPKPEQIESTEYDYSDYHWGDLDEADEAVIEEPAFDKAPKVAANSQATTELLHESKSNDANSSKLPQPESLEKPQKNSKVDPLASLHAALGLGSNATDAGSKIKAEHKPEKDLSVEKNQVSSTASSAIESLHDTQPLEAPKAFSKSIEDELEETSKQPLSIPDGVDEVEELEKRAENEPLDNRFNQLKQELSETVALEREIIVQSEEQAAVPANLNQTSKESYLLEKVSDDWARVVLKLGLVGTLEQIAHSSLFDWQSDNQASIQVDPKLDLICTDSAKAGIEEALIGFYDKTISIDWSFSEAKRETPAMIFERLLKEKHAKACETLVRHPFSQELIKHFDAQLIKPSVSYLE